MDSKARRAQPNSSVPNTTITQRDVLCYLVERIMCIHQVSKSQAPNPLLALLHSRASCYRHSLVEKSRIYNILFKEFRYPRTKSIRNVDVCTPDWWVSRSIISLQPTHASCITFYALVDSEDGLVRYLMTSQSFPKWPPTRRSTGISLSYL